MEMVNALTSTKKFPKLTVARRIEGILIACCSAGVLAPHITEEIREATSWGSIHKQPGRLTILNYSGR